MKSFICIFCGDAIVCAGDLKKLDAEVKVLIGCSDEEKKSICDFHTGDKTGALLVDRIASFK